MSITEKEAEVLMHLQEINGESRFSIQDDLEGNLYLYDWWEEEIADTYFAADLIVSFYAYELTEEEQKIIDNLFKKIEENS